jgi:hypothetical protein
LPESQYAFAYRTFTFCGSLFQAIQLTHWFLTLRHIRTVSIGQLRRSPVLHLRPIDLVVFQEPSPCGGFHWAVSNG